MKFRVSNNDLSEIQERLDGTKPGSKFTFEIKRAGTYSQQQQGYYRGVCIKMIADYCGYQGVQGFYVGDNEIIMDGYDYVHGLIKGLHKRRTSTDCNVEEYGRLIDTAITLGQSLGINIPPPTI